MQLMPMLFCWVSWTPSKIHPELYKKSSMTHNFYPFFLGGDEAFLAADVGFCVFFWGLPNHLANMNGCFTLTKCGLPCAAKMTLRVGRGFVDFGYHFENLGFFFQAGKWLSYFGRSFWGILPFVWFVFFVFHGN